MVHVCSVAQCGAHQLVKPASARPSDTGSHKMQAKQRVEETTPTSSHVACCVHCHRCGPDGSCRNPSSGVPFSTSADEVAVYAGCLAKQSQRMQQQSAAPAPPAATPK